MSENNPSSGRSFPLWDALVATFRNLGRPMVTEPLPWERPRERKERFRATFALVHNEHGEEACIGCKMCEKICPSQIIDVTPAGRKESPVTGKKRGYCADFTLDLNACLVCELCVQVCPEDSILMLKERAPVGFSREDLVLTMDRLYANEKRELLAWHSGSVFGEMQDPKRGLPEPPPRAKPAPKKAAPARPAPAKPAAEAKPAEATPPAPKVEEKPPVEKAPEPPKAEEAPKAVEPPKAAPGRALPPADVPEPKALKPKAEEPSTDEGGEA